MSGDFEIPDIPEVPDGILRASSRGKLIVFVGAGVSRIPGCSSWQQFAVRYLEYLRTQNFITYREFERLSRLNPRMILSICQNILEDMKKERPDMNELLRTKGAIECKLAKIYDDIVSFNAIYVTTNYDDFLWSASSTYMNMTRTLGKEQFLDRIMGTFVDKSAIRLYKRKDMLVSKLSPGNILHIHGSVEQPENAVITLKDYMKCYVPNSEVAVLLKEIFQSDYTVLFIGYGLEEYEVLEFMLNKSTAGTIRKESPHFMLFPVFKEDNALVGHYLRYYLDLGVQICPYNISDNGYEQLVNVVEKWAKAIGSTARTQNFFDRVKLIDEVVR